MLGFDIDLYEDSTGNLYLHPMMSDWVYQTDPDFPFEEECQALYENESEARIHWLSSWVHSYANIRSLLIHPETYIIATWHNDGSYTLHWRQPGNAARRYLNLKGEPS